MVEDSFDAFGGQRACAFYIFLLTSSLEAAIPSASAISAAKEKRGRRRGTEGDDDFISLSVSKLGDVPQGPHPESRLMREEDELGEGEDGMLSFTNYRTCRLCNGADMAEFTGAQERIALGKKARKDEERKRRMGMIEMIEDAWVLFLKPILSPYHLL